MYSVCSGSEARTVYFFRRIVNRDPIVQVKSEGIYLLVLSFVDKNSATCQTSPPQLQKTHLHLLYSYSIHFRNLVSCLYSNSKKQNTSTTIKKLQNNSFNTDPPCPFFKKSHTFQNANHKRHSSSRTSPGLVIHHGEPYRDPQENLLEQRGWQNLLW